MKLGKRLAGIGFAIGFLGSFLFYASPPAWPTSESGLVCPWCPYVDFVSVTKYTWLEIGLKVGLISGLLFAVGGFSAGCLAELAGRKMGRRQS